MDPAPKIAVTPHDAPPARPARRGIRYALLLVLPCAAFMLGGKIDRADGPRWRWQAYDPEYAYLLNSVNIAEGHPPGHTHHPGTPVQMLGAAVLTLRHLATEPGVPLRRQILDDPTGGIHAISVVLRLVHAFALGAFGIAGLRLTRSVACALAAQATTLLSLSAVTSLHAVAPEPLMMAITLLLAASMMMALARPGPVRPRFAIITGVITAAGLATKITFAPACLAVWGVLIGPRPTRGGTRDTRRVALLHVAAAAAALPLFIAPALGQAGVMLEWFRSLAMRDGMYGRPAGHTIVNLQDYPRRLAELIEAEPVTAAVAAGGAILAAALFIPVLARRLDDPARRARAALAVLASVQLIQFVLVAKHPGPRYLLAATTLAGLSVCLGFVLLRAVLHRPRTRLLLAGLGALAMGWGVVQTNRSLREFLAVRGELAGRQVALAREVEPFESAPGRPGSGAVLVYSYWSSAPGYALHFGNHWAGFRYSEDLTRMFPDRVLYAADAKLRYRDSLMNEVPRAQLLEWAAQGRLYFHMWASELPEGFAYEQISELRGLFRATPPKHGASP